MDILGISAFFHDSAAAFVRDGEILAAAQEERFTRVKNERRFPGAAIAYCVRAAGVDLGSVDRVVYYETPVTKLRRQIGTIVAVAPRGFAQFRNMVHSWKRLPFHHGKQIVQQLSAIAPDVDWESRLEYCEHHLSHAAAAFYPSPFQEAAILTVDAVGEWATTTVGVGRGGHVEIASELHFPHSLGMLYSAFTNYLGFKVNSGEYKMMGLAPYGRPAYAQTILERLIDVKPDGTFRLDMGYFDYAQGLRMTNENFHRLFGGKPRDPAAEIEPRPLDLAASIQKVTEHVLVKLARTARVEDRGQKSDDGGRRGAELRGQQRHPARRYLRRPVDPASGRRRRQRARRGPARLPSQPAGPGRRAEAAIP